MDKTEKTPEQLRADKKFNKINEGAWAITWGNPENGLEGDVGTSGPWGSTIKAVELINNPLSYEFRMYEDGETSPDYQGWCYLPDGFTEAAFGPLDDFGEGNTGCVWIEYKNKETGEWEPL
jgi:hypothetical protein